MIIDVKESLYSEELKNKSLIKFIFHGRLIKDQEKIKDIDFTDNCFMHCYITPSNLLNDPLNDVEMQ